MAKKQDSMGELVSLSENQLYPRMAKPSDFGAAPPAPKDNGEPTLWDMPENLEMTRHAEDGGSGSSGAGTPSNDRTAMVAKNFKSMQNTSESGTSVKVDLWVDLKDGQHSCANVGKA